MLAVSRLESKTVTTVVVTGTWIAFGIGSTWVMRGPWSSTVVNCEEDQPDARGQPFESRTESMPMRNWYRVPGSRRAETQLTVRPSLETESEP